MKKILYPAAIAVFALSAISAQAVVITQWTFEAYTAPTGTFTTLATPIAADTGTGSANGVHASVATFTTPVGNGSAKSISVNTWAVGDYWQFATSTTGFSSIGLSWDQASSNTGPRDFILSYSTDGVNFTNFGATYAVLANAAPNPTWGSVTPQPVFSFAVDLSSVSALNNAANVTFRLTNNSTVSANAGTVAAAGTDRVDNFTVSTTPEPTTMAALGLGAIALIRRRRSK